MNRGAMLGFYLMFLVVFHTFLFTRGEPTLDFFDEDSTDFPTDIRMERSHRSRSKRSMVADPNRLWPSAIIPFQIKSDALVDEDILREGMHRWEERTCIRFVPWNSTVAKTLPHDDRITFVKEDECRSAIGRISMNDSISACNDSFIVKHEIGHSIGLYHEHNRPDRDEHITMLWYNVPPGEVRHYAKRVTAMNDAEYDLGSIMHYGKSGPPETKLPATRFVTVDPLLQYDVGPTRDITFYDAKSVNLAYNCSAKCSKKLKCENGGYQGHKCKCICPEKYMGTYCQKRNSTVKEKCRFALTNESGSVSSPNFPSNYDNNVFCMWYIKVKPGYRIVLNFTSFNFEPAPGCKSDSILIRTDDLYDGGVSFCGFDLPPVITSSSNQAWLRMYTDKSTTESGFHLNYYSTPNEEKSRAICWRRSCYRFFNEEMSLFQAQEKCQSIGGALPVISSRTENDFLRRKMPQMLPGKLHYWIALNNFTIAGQFVWGSTREQSMYQSFDLGTILMILIYRKKIDSAVSDVYGGWHNMTSLSTNSSVVCEIWKSKTTKASFNKWSKWNDCPVSCGGSIQLRTRECNFPEECTGVVDKKRYCNTQPCPGSIARFKRTHASSVWRTLGRTWDSADVVDGFFWPKLIATHASSLHTLSEYQPWWRVDIQDPYVVTGLRITKCLDHDYKTPWADATVGFNNDLLTNPVCSQVTLRKDNIQTTVQCTKPLLGNVVGIQIKSSTRSSLCITEVEVFTTGSALSCPRDIQLLLPVGKSGVNVSWPANGSKGIGILECTHTPGTVFSEGITPVQCNVTDTAYSEYIRRCSFRIEIIVCDIIMENRCTRFIKKRQKRAKAQDACLRNGGNLLTIRSELHNKRVQSMIAHQGKVFRMPWIGFEDISNNDTWTWSSGLKSPISKFFSRTSARCAIFKPNGQWRTTSCNKKFSAICETDIKFPTMQCPTNVRVTVQTGYRNLFVDWSIGPIVIDPLRREFTTSCNPIIGFSIRPGALKKVTCTGNAYIDGAVVSCTFNVRACSEQSGSNCYVVTNELLQWKDAKKRCKSLGGSLVAVGSSNQTSNTSIVRNVLQRTYGPTHNQDVWIDWERPLSNNDELCVTMKPDETWIDVDCDQLRRSVCVIIVS